MAEQQPKAFISYSWSSPGHCDLIRSLAERLLSDGIDILIDQWNLSEGQDKYAFMEKMVTDPSVSHVIIFSDQTYSQKANERKAGVGTESQIISREVYEKVDQKKFIPVVCQRREDGEPYLPVFLESRIWIDFSSPEALNENWERLVRALFGKPIHEKPAIGKPPSYLANAKGRPALPTIGKFNTLRNALFESKPTTSLCRNDFLNAAIEYADQLRVREKPSIENLREKVLQDLHALLPLRDQLIDWLQIEVSVGDSQTLEKILVDFLERILALRYRPEEITTWNDAWFDAHKIFAYEIFLYVIAVLLKSDRVDLVNALLTMHYLLPDSEANRSRDFVAFDEFYTNSEVLNNYNAQLNPRRLSPIADLINQRGTRSDVTFGDVLQAEFVILLVAILSDKKRWYPHTAVYSGGRNGRLPLFIRATQHKFFQKIKTITGIGTGNELREQFKAGSERHGVDRWTDLTFHAGVSISSAMNIENLDTIN